MDKISVQTRKHHANHNRVRRAKPNYMANHKTRILLGFSEDGNIEMVRASSYVSEINKRLLLQYVKQYNHFEIDEVTLFDKIHSLNYEVDTVYFHNCDCDLISKIKIKSI